MKQFFKYVALILIATVVIVAAFFAVALVPLAPAPSRQVVNAVHFVSDGSTVAIVPTGPHQVLLVDSGMDPSAAKVLAELTRLGETADSVSAIFFTHGHFDHTGGAGQFPKAALMALAPDAELIAGVAGSRGPLTQFFRNKPTGLKLTRALHDGDTVPVGQVTVKVFAIPGHTSGSAGYLIDGVLYVGDSANATKKGTLQSATWLFTDDIQQNEASLRSLDERLLEGGNVVKVIAFGHSGVLERGLAPLTEWAKEHTG